MLNALFSQEYADDRFKGEASEDNIRYQWEDEFLIRGVQKIEVHLSDNYELSGVHPVKGTFSYFVANMRVVLLHHGTDEITKIAVSERLLTSFTQQEIEEGFSVVIEMRDDEPFINPITGVYIANRDIPRELKND